MSLDRQRQFRNGDGFIGDTGIATLEESALSLSTPTGDIILTAEETRDLADFLYDQCSYPLVADRLARIHQHVLKGALTKETIYPILVELLIPFLPKDMLEHLQDILAALISKKEGYQA